jgi:hypothetical protein
MIGVLASHLPPAAVCIFAQFQELHFWVLMAI